MSLAKKRVWLALLIVLGVIITGLCLVWFIIFPRIIESDVNAILQSVSEKTGRHIEIDGVRLTGITSAKVKHLTVSDLNSPEDTGVQADDIAISLRRGIPNDPVSSSFFSISSIDVGSLEVFLRRDGDKTNFDDILEKLKPKGEDEDSVKTESVKPWKRYITPFPSIQIESFALSTSPMEIREDLKIGALSVSDIQIKTMEDVQTVYEISGQVSAQLIESGTPMTYEAAMAGHVQNSKIGTFTVSYPKSKDGKSPAVFTQGEMHIGFDEAQFILPSTFAVLGLKIDQGARSVIHADSARARLMQLPPKKVSGVYFKEIELTAPEIHDMITDDGSVLMNWVKDLQKQWLPPKNGHIVVAPTKANSAPKDHFFSQRFFITDGSFELEDMRVTPLPSVNIKELDLEIGYRSIRKILDYQISLKTDLPVESSIGFEGVYDIRTDTTNGRFELKSLHGTNVFHQFQDALEAHSDHPFWKTVSFLEKSAVFLKLEKYIPKLDISSAFLSGFIGFDIQLNEEKLSLNTSLDCTNAKLKLDSLSKDAVDLSGNVSLQADLDLRKHDYDLKEISIKTPNGTHLTSSVHLTEVDRKVKDRGPNRTPEYVKSWQFNIQSDLPKQNMQTVFDAIPPAFRPDLEGIVWTGTIDYQFTASGYLDKISESQHKFTLNLSPDFGISKWPANRNLNALNNGMTHTVIDPNALNTHTIAIPPSIYPIVVQNVPIFTPRHDADNIRAMYPDWVLFDDLNPWLVQLITTTEDGNFFNHNGFSPLQIKAALEKNINTKSFSRGASTISMQLIKNLYFDRNKTIARKFQEFIYTWLMESVLHIPKQRIMELYFNIIEFGPEIYGIEDAAKYYFGKRSADLSLKESAFLMAIIPKPFRGPVQRSKPQLDKWIQDTMNFYIREMYRRKCNPETLASMRNRYARKGQEMPFEPCCPPKDSLQLMLDSDTMSFYIPNPQNPAEYGYRPDLYTDDGLLHNPSMRKRSCGLHSSSDSELESIFETLSTDQLPSKADIFGE